jgi:hypothetical protein
MFRTDDTALYFTDNGRIVCGRHLGASARATGRDISGQAIKEATPDEATRWLHEVGESMQCEECGATFPVG